MIRIVKEIGISASPEIIWTMMVKHLKNPKIEADHDSEWKELAVKNVKGEALTAKRKGLGVKTRWHYRFFGFPFKWDDEVIEWKELKRIVWKSISKWDMIDSFTIIPQNSKSKLIYEMNYTPPYGILGKIHFNLLVHKHMEKNIEYTLRQMKNTAEKLIEFQHKRKKFKS